MSQCSVCTLVDGSVDPVSRMCNACRVKLGVIPMPPPRQKRQPCAKCNGTKFVRVIPREYTATGGDYVSTVAAPMTATQWGATSDRFLFAGRDVSAPDIRAGAGVLEIYICTGCGFVEWYCLNPESIPIGPEYMTEVVDHGSETPYR